MSVVLNINRLAGNNLLLVNETLKTPLYYLREDVLDEDRKKLASLQNETYKFGCELQESIIFELDKLIKVLESFIKKVNILLKTQSYKNNYHLVAFRTGIMDMMINNSC